MNHAWGGDGHLRSDPGVRLQELEMFHHGMIGEADLARNADALRLGLDALKLNAVIELVELHPVEHAEEIEVPVSSSKLPIGRELEPDFLLLLDDLFDFAVFDLFELITAYGPFLALGTRILQRLAALEAAHVVGTKRWGLVGHRTRACFLIDEILRPHSHHFSACASIFRSFLWLSCQANVPPD